MVETDPDAQHAEASEALGAYVVGGLDATETTKVRRHLERCPSCRKELAELEGLHELLEAATLAEEPPVELEERVVAAMLRAGAAPRATRLRSAAGSGYGGLSPAARRLTRSLSAFGAAAMVAALLAVAVAYQLARQEEGSSSAQPLPSAAAPSPAGALKLVAAGGSPVSERTVVPENSVAPTVIPTGGGGPASTARPGGTRGPGFPGGELLTRASGGTWECDVTVWGLEPGQLYEVWFRGRRGLASGGSFRVDDYGIKTVTVSTGLRFSEVVEVLITAEPDDGNPAPTGEVVLRAEIP